MSRLLMGVERIGKSLCLVRNTQLRKSPILASETYCTQGKDKCASKYSVCHGPRLRWLTGDKPLQCFLYCCVSLLWAELHSGFWEGAFQQVTHLGWNRVIEYTFTLCNSLSLDTRAERDGPSLLHPAIKLRRRSFCHFHLAPSFVPSKSIQTLPDTSSTTHCTMPTLPEVLSAYSVLKLLPPYLQIKDLENLSLSCKAIHACLRDNQKRWTHLKSQCRCIFTGRMTSLCEFSEPIQAQLRILQGGGIE